MSKWFFILLPFLLVCSVSGIAQTDSLEIVDLHGGKVRGAFFGSRVVQSHSVEMIGKRNLDFRILHRFGLINDGIKEMFGLDHASMRLGFDYGVTDNFTIGIGRSTLRKEYDLFAKARLLQQQAGSKNIPFSLVVSGGAFVWSEDYFGNETLDGLDRFSWMAQLTAGRKFSSKFSLQANVSFIAQTLAPVTDKSENTVAAGLAGRIGLGKRTALIFDYNRVLNNRYDGMSDPLGVGIDIETGGHVFQLHCSNSAGMNERAFLFETTDEFFKGEIRFGFNLSRMFQVGKRW